MEQQLICQKATDFISHWYLWRLLKHGVQRNLIGDLFCHNRIQLSGWRLRFFFSLIGYRPYWRPGMHCFSHLDTKRPCAWECPLLRLPLWQDFASHPQHSHSIGGAVQPNLRPIPNRGVFGNQKGHPGVSSPNYGHTSMETGSKLSKEFTQSKISKVWKTINISYL